MTVALTTDTTDGHDNNLDDPRYCVPTVESGRVSQGFVATTANSKYDNNDVSTRLATTGPMIYERRRRAGRWRLIPVAYRTVRCFQKHYTRAGCFSRKMKSEAPLVDRRFSKSMGRRTRVTRVILLTNDGTLSIFKTRINSPEFF